MSLFLIVGYAAEDYWGSDHRRSDAMNTVLQAVGHRTRAHLRRCLICSICALVAPVLLVRFAAAQQSAPPVEPSPPAAQPAPDLPGLFVTIGRLIDQGAAGFRSHLDGAKGSFDELNQRAATTGKNIGDTAVEVGKSAVGAGVSAADATKDAVGAAVKLPLSRVVTGRERCTTAPNGAPDCLAAADALCRKQGFSNGKSLDFTSAEQCPPRVRLSGRQSEADCTTVTFISRALCQ